MDAVLEAFVPFVLAAGPPAPDQLDLQQMQRVDVGEAMADRTCQCRIAGEAILFAGDQRQHVHRALPFVADGVKHPPAQHFVLHQLAVA